ncbi:hypothetical protein [Microaceticoccus formicicus]|uniref:hypothetical protein n=1 Tax=Microaceticoccus formicicus TaxID=3118105 RepID=UPI003CD049E6|nr:hypothetical protein VZL98_00495 [Peptoniphilaceae bacterium AMB_02]
MREFKKIVPYLVVNFIAFYLLPNLISDTGSGMFILLVIIPLTCVLTGIVLGMKNTFKWYYPVLVGLLFIPSIYIYYNESALVYAPAYGILALIGSLLGKMVFRLKGR